MCSLIQYSSVSGRDRQYNGDVIKQPHCSQKTIFKPPVGGGLRKLIAGSCGYHWVQGRLAHFCRGPLWSRVFPRKAFATVKQQRFTSSSHRVMTCTQQIDGWLVLKSAVCWLLNVCTSECRRRNKMIATFHLFHNLTFRYRFKQGSRNLTCMIRFCRPRLYPSGPSAANIVTSKPLTQVLRN